LVVLVRAETFPSMTLTTAGGAVLRTETNDGKYTVNGSTIFAPNIVTSNGVVHVIEELLLPEGINLASL
jgi:uncharacterized surface protein with fasciclin (FAS1) repeats